MDTEDNFNCDCKKCNLRFEKIVDEINTLRMQNEMLLRNLNKLIHIFNLKITDLYANVAHIQNYVPESHIARGPVILQNHFESTL